MSRRRPTGPTRAAGPARIVRVAPLVLLAIGLGSFAAVAPPRAAFAQGVPTAQMLIGKAVSDDDQAGEVTNAIGRFMASDFDGCRATLERVRSANPKLPPTGVMMSMLWMNVNRIAEARAELEDTTLKFPADPEPFLMLGDLAFQDRRITESNLLFNQATELTKAFTENPKRKRDFEIRCNAGMAAVAEARRQWDAARKHIEAWMALDPDNASARQRLGIVLFQLGEEDKALEQFRESKKLDPKSLQPELWMARLYSDAKKRDVARKQIEAAVKAAPGDVGVLLGAAEWYLAQNDLDAAKTNAEAALAADEKNLAAKLLRGTVARVARDYRTAERFLNEAHVQSPGNFPASNSLALVLIESEEKESRQRALEMAEANVAMYRDNGAITPNALTTLAWIYYRLGRRDDAEKVLARVTQGNSLPTDGAYYLAKVLSDRGDNDKARAILEQVLGGDAFFSTRADAVDLLDKIKSGAAK
ncbi:MAG: tetratricopeptide repeat protein [Planctomycetaceae bacterium]